jgi:hypothetical protein
MPCIYEDLLHYEGSLLILSTGRPKDKKNDDSVSLQRALEPHYIHKVDGKD